jgi:riboflavin synthase
MNGVSLTCFNSKQNGFSVAIIPYTFDHTNFSQIKKGDTVNLEFDIIGKYVKRLLGLNKE